MGEKNSNGYRLLQLSRPIQFLRGPILANFSSTICAPESLRCPISSHSFTLCPHFCQKALCLRNSNFTWIGRRPTRDQWQIEWTRGTKKASPVRKFGPHPLQDKLIHLHFFLHPSTPLPTPVACTVCFFGFLSWLLHGYFLACLSVLSNLFHPPHGFQEQRFRRNLQYPSTFLG